MIPSFRPTFLNAEIASSMSARVCRRQLAPHTRLTLRHHRIPEARHEHPSSSIMLLIWIASAVSHTMIGTIGVSPASGLKPTSVIAYRK